MKITNKEIIDEFKKLFDSYTDEGFSKAIAEEYERIRFKEDKNEISS